MSPYYNSILKSIDMNEPASSKPVGVSDYLNTQGVVHVLEAPVYIVKIHGICLEANVRTLISINPVASSVKIVPIKFSSGRYGVPERLCPDEFEVE